MSCTTPQSPTESLVPQIHGTSPQTFQELLELGATDVGGSLWERSPTHNRGAPVCYSRASPGGHLAHCRLSHDTSDNSFRFFQFHYRSLWEPNRKKNQSKCWPEKLPCSKSLPQPMKPQAVLLSLADQGCHADRMLR